jgi:hypothetical protein
MNSYIEKDGLSDVVFQVGWTCSGTDGTCNAAAYGEVTVTLAPGSTFIPYADLTLPVVNSWVADALGPEGVANAIAAIDSDIARQANPVTTTLPLPW